METDPSSLPPCLFWWRLSWPMRAAVVQWDWCRTECAETQMFPSYKSFIFFRKGCVPLNLWPFEFSFLVTIDIFFLSQTHFEVTSACYLILKHNRKHKVKNTCFVYISCLCGVIFLCLLNISDFIFLFFLNMFCEAKSENQLVVIQWKSISIS